MPVTETAGRDGEPKKVLTFEQATAKVSHEHALINHRMTWLVLSQAFLLAAYFNLRSSNAMDPGVPVILYSIVFSGVILCVVFGASFYAAFWAIRTWREICNEEDKEKVRALTSRARIHFLGDAPPAVIAWALLSFWASIAYSDHSKWWPKLAWYEVVTPLIVLVVGTMIWVVTVWMIFFKSEER